MGGAAEQRGFPYDLGFASRSVVELGVSAYTMSSPLSSPGDALVELRNVTFGYGERVILRDLSLAVPRGKVTALMGASGGGKTTVLRLIGGQQRAQQGEVLVGGQDVGRMDTAQLYAARRRMGMLFQFGALFTDMSVYENVAFPLREHTDLPEDLIRDIIVPSGKPVLAGLMIGHVNTKITVPLGVRCRMDAGAGTLEILESAFDV